MRRTIDRAMGFRGAVHAFLGMPIVILSRRLPLGQKCRQVRAPLRAAGSGTSADGTMRAPGASDKVEMRLAVGKEVQNSRTKSAFQAPHSNCHNALLTRFGQLTVDRGRGPQWAAASWALDSL